MIKSRYPEERAGRVLIPHVIDDLAHEEPDRILYEFPQAAETIHTYRSVSAAAFANAINRASWFLERSLGKGANFETLGYVGPGDLRYIILTVAAIKAGYKVRDMRWIIHQCRLTNKDAIYISPKQLGRRNCSHRSRPMQDLAGSSEGQ